MRIKTLSHSAFYSCAECGRLTGLVLVQLGAASLTEICLCVGCAERLADELT